jgi:hypothetical protein
LQNENIIASVSGNGRSGSHSFLFFINARKSNKGVGTAVRLFPAGTSLDTVKRNDSSTTELVLGQYLPFSLVISKGHRADPLRGESHPSTIFSISIYKIQGVAEPDSEEMTKSESEEASDSESEENVEPERDVEMS